MRYCDICGSKQQTKIFKDVVICGNCQFAYNSKCEQAERTAYYKEMEKKSYYITYLPTSPLYTKQQLSTAEYIKEHIKGIALDVGCFTGEILTLLKRGEGIDPSKNAVNIALSKGLTVIHGDIFTHTFERKYDTIILSHVLEHIVDLKRLVLILSELLNDDGIIIVETPDATKFNLETDSTFINDQKEPLIQFSYEHVNYFTPYSLKNLFVNFTIIYSEHITSTVHTLRMVFRKKKDNLIKHSLKGHIKESMREFKRMNEVIKTIDYPIYVWGLGAFTMKLLEYTDLDKCDIRGFIDNTAKPFNKIPVIKKPVEDIPILIGTMQYRDYVKELYKDSKLIEL